MVGEGGGKTVMAQIFLAMMARANPLISILERGDSYRTPVELMGGRVIEVNLEGTETLNPWDLPPGQVSPSKEKIAFLKNLTPRLIPDLVGIGERKLEPAGLRDSPERPIVQPSRRRTPGSH